MYIKFKSPLHLSAITKVPFNATANRSQFRIGIIDNDPFSHTNELRAHGYNLTELGDISDFGAVAEYPIVACDIMDVGSHFGAELQGGAHVLAEIRRRYPGKFLIAYSAGTFGATYKKYWDACDVCLRRDGGFEQWVETLDRGIIALGDPAQHWRRTRRLLLDSDTSAFEVFLLEEAYIKSILSKNSFHIVKAMERVKRSTAAGEIFDNITDGLITSVKLFIRIMA
jgi:hypothetical protein